MSLKNVKPGLHDIGQYEISGVPYLATVGASSSMTITLKYVASEVTVTASGGTLTINFGQSNSANVTVPDGGVMTVRGKIRTITVATGAGCIGSVVASLTGIKSGNLPVYDQNDYGGTA